MRQARAVRGLIATALALCALGGAVAGLLAPSHRAAAALPSVAIPPGGNAGTSATSRPATGPTTHAAEDAIPRPTLLEMYQRELGAKYNPADADKLVAAHQLIEQYFDASTGAERKALVGQIRGVGLDPNVVGRITRLRMYWPALEPEGVYYVNERVGPYFVRYFFGLPKGYDRARPWPLVIKLPTANAFLTNPPPDGNQVAAIYTEWVKDELSRHPDAVVLMPLLNLMELYGPSYAGMNTVIQPMLHVAGRANIDPARVYLIGHSMAAHAVWNIGLHYTTYFAALNPMAGGARAEWQRLRVVNLRNVLPVVWHDADDPVIKVESSRGIVRALRMQKINVEYVETKRLGHAPDPETAERLYQTVRARVRDLYPKEVTIQSDRPDTMFNRIDWLQAWEPVEAGKERRILIARGTGPILLNTNPLRIDATRPRSNRIDVTTQNVGSFRIYLNDQMVDFASPVTIVVNKRPLFEGQLKADVDEMLKDQLFLGRGWRYFTSAVDVDLVKANTPATRPATRPAPASRSAAPATPRASTRPAIPPAGRGVAAPARG